MNDEDRKTILELARKSIAPFQAKPESNASGKLEPKPEPESKPKAQAEVEPKPKAALEEKS